MNLRFCSSYLDYCNRLGLTQQRKKKISRVLNMLGKMGFTEKGQENVDRCFDWIQQRDDISDGTKSDYWHIYKRYMKWLDSSLKLNYKMKYTKKRRLPEILSPKEIMKMINHTTCARNRAIICLMFDAGLRPGEVVNLRVEHCIFDEDGLIIDVPEEGKRGRRRIRVVTTMNSDRALEEWLRYHEYKSDPYSPLFYRLDRRNKGSIGTESLNKLLQVIARRSGIKKKITSYTIRHSSATYLSKFLSDSEMRVYFGWSPGSDQIKTYVHLSCKDLDEKVLELNNKPTKKKEKEDLRELIREELLRVLKSI